MRSAILIPIAFAAAALLGGGPSLAYYDGPWCGVSTIGRGSAIEKCDYRTFEACRMDIIAGNRGFCRPNGYFQGYAASDGYKPRKRHKHVHR